MNNKGFLIVFLLLESMPATAWNTAASSSRITQIQASNFGHCDDDKSVSEVSLSEKMNRRVLMKTMAASSGVLLSNPSTASAASDDKPKEFVNVGTQAPAPDGESPFVTLSNGVQIKDFRLGSGDNAVQPQSSVQIQCTGRLLNLNGVVFFSTKNNNPDGFGAIPLSVNLGRGEVVPGLESGLVGMKKGGIRRIIVPANLAYDKAGYLEPKPINANDERALDSVVKNSRRDGTILFDVSLERFK